MKIWTVVLWMAACWQLSTRLALASPSPAGSENPTLAIPGNGKGGLVPLSDGSLVLWLDNGLIQIKGPNGRWSPVVSLGVKPVWQVVSDGQGILGVGERDLPGERLQSSVFLTDARGTVVQRWEPASGRAFTVASGNGAHWATISGEYDRATRTAQFDPRIQAGPLADQLAELIPDGGIAPREKVEKGARIISFTGGQTATGRVDCVPADLTKSNYHFPYCAVGGQGGWRNTGLWDILPLACGPYLIEILDRLAGSDLPHRDKPPQVTVRRLDTGATVVTKPTTRGQTFACGSPGELLTGRTDVLGLSLPELNLIWRASSRGGTVVALTRDANKRLWVATSSKKVFSPDDDLVRFGSDATRPPSTPNRSSPRAAKVQASP